VVLQFPREPTLGAFLGRLSKHRRLGTPLSSSCSQNIDGICHVNDGAWSNLDNWVPITTGRYNGPLGSVRFSQTRFYVSVSSQ
jgi:hypothetical protein